MAGFTASKEKKKLNKLFKQLTKDKQDLVQGLVADASFQIEQLEILRAHIAENGWSEEYKNGSNQYGKKTSVEADTYLKMQKSYASLIRQLSDLLPEDKNVTQRDELLDFISSR